MGNYRRMPMHRWAHVSLASICIALTSPVWGQKTSSVNADVSEGGQLNAITFTGENGFKVPLHSGEYAGPSFYGHWAGEDHKVTLTPQGDGFVGEKAGFGFKLRYVQKDDTLELHASVRNLSKVIAQPKTIGLRLGLNTSMDSFPDWYGQFAPTFMRAEKTHFTGYMMSPDGHILAIASRDPVASWSVLYNDRGERQDLRPAGYLQDWGGHKMRSANIDLISAGPLPERHPADLHSLRGGEEKSWVIAMKPVNSLAEVPSALAAMTAAPFFDIQQTVVEPGAQANLAIHTSEPLFIDQQSPSGMRSLLPGEATENEVRTAFSSGETGLHTIRATDSDGDVSEAMIYVRKPWSWYLDKARDGAFEFPQRATSHAESWYGFYTMYEAARLLPDAEKLAATDAVLNDIYPVLYDPQTNAPIKQINRIQNHATMIGILTDRYAATGDITALNRASDIADWLVSESQAEDGSYRSSYSGDGTHYTSVIYIAKSIMELMEQEKMLADSDPSWRRRYDRHYASAKAAIDDLVRRDGHVETEGEMTYEDGMISCTALQIGMFALLQTDPALRDHYLESIIRYMDGHESLEQLVVPDARMRGGTLRFWESQYDILMQPNFFNSPHGWTSWNTYATYYRYLLTGDPKFLVRTMNALGAAAQMVDHDTGELRWSFVSNPRIDAIQVSEPQFETVPEYMEGHNNPDDFPSRTMVVGEQYLDMVGDWQIANIQENDVHEHFKALAEIAIDKAYVVETADGEWMSFNARIAETAEGTLLVTPAEDLVSSVHINLLKSNDRVVRVAFANGEVSNRVAKGMSWINPAD